MIPYAKSFLQASVLDQALLFSFNIFAFLLVILLSSNVALTPMAQAQPIQEPALPSLPTTTVASAEAPPERAQPLLPPGLDADLLSVARLCTDLSKVATTEALPDLLRIVMAAHRKPEA